MPSGNKSGNTTVVVAVVGGLVVLAGAAWYFVSRKQEEETAPQLGKKKAASPTVAPSSTSSHQTAPSTTAAAAAPTSSSPQNSMSVENSDEGMLRNQTTMLVNDYSFVGDVGHDHKDVQVKPYQPPVADRDGNINFQSLGVSLQLARGWNATEEPSPMPNVALLAFGKPEFADRDMNMPGAVPMVLLSIEDVSNEKVTIEEFKDKSKMMALQQMAMMTGGQLMPNVREDEKLAQPIGPFTHLLMYELRAPGFGLQVLNLTAMQDGLAFIFQVMSNPEEFTETRKAVVQMAKSVKFASRPEVDDFTKTSYVKMGSVGGTLLVPAQWSIDKAVAVNPVFVASTPSQQRKETVEVYNTKLEKVIDLSKPVKKATVNVRGVDVVDYGTSMRVATYGDAVVVATAKHSGAVLISAETLATIALNVDFKTKSDEDRQYYHNATLSIGFEKRKSGRIVESRLTERIVVYAPNGLPTDPAATDDFPMLTIRVGDPSNDPDCRTSLDEWMQRIRDESESDNFTDLKKDNIAGRECVTFITKDMQETGMQQREERTAKMIIFLTGIRTTMLRWESPSGTWRKHESKLRNLLNTLTLPDTA